MSEQDARRAEITRARQRGRALLVAAVVAVTAAAVLEPSHAPTWLWLGLLIVGLVLGLGFRRVVAAMAAKARQDAGKE
jgi:hypothetical protein